MTLGGILLAASNGMFNISTTDIGWFLMIFTLITAILLIGAMKQNSALSFIFLTLLIGFILLDVSHLGGPSVFTTVAAVDLILCAAGAWYLMAHAIFAQLGIELPVGKPWIR